jgi:hypothetical protein
LPHLLDIRSRNSAVLAPQVLLPIIRCGYEPKTTIPSRATQLRESAREGEVAVAEHENALARVVGHFWLEHALGPRLEPSRSR